MASESEEEESVVSSVVEVVVAISCVVVASAESFFEGLHPAKAKMIEHVKNKYNIFSLQYPPLVCSLALYLRKKLDIPIQKVLFIKAQRDMLDIFYDESLNHLGWQPKERFLVKALRFQGFTPVSKYRMRSKYAYIMTNRMLENEYWVFPMRLADNYKSMQNPKYKFYTEVFGKVGIPGIIKIKYSNGN